MHKNKIPERQPSFYEEWHQKLHNNTTPDDIIICEALLKYLNTGDMSKYWAHLNGNGVTKERMASYERSITREPYMKKEVIHDFENYLKLLK
jgi:alpha-glucan,water dikinase